MNEERQTTTKCENGVFKQVEQAQRKQINLMSAKQLQDTEFPPIEWVVDGFIPKRSLYILSAKSKIGKSFLSLQMGIAVSTGATFLNMRTHKGAVLYLDLEENPIMLQSRLDKQLAGAQAPDDLLITNEFSTMNDTFVEDITNILNEHPNIVLIIVDVYQKIKKVKPSNVTDYEDTYANFSPLKDITQKYGCSIILVTHDRKMNDESDPFSNILGSTAIMGASDGAIAIYKKKRSDPDATMSIIGRQISQEDYAVRFNKDSLLWKMIGSSVEVMEQRQRQEYEQNPLVKTIRKAFERSPQGFAANCKDLIDFAKMYSIEIAWNEHKVSNELKKIEENLMYYDTITIERQSNGTGGSKRIFKHIFND